MNVLRLSSGPLVCELRPDLGGCIAGLWFQGEPVLRSTPAADLHTVRLSGSYPLVPFSNRIGEANLWWQGTGHPLVRNFAPEPHAIHGVGWQREWQVLEADENFALLAYEHRADASWPFTFDSSQTLRLDPEGLSLTLSVTNQSDRPAPLGLGWHPYFTKRADSHLSFTATGRWEMGTDKLPTEHRATTGIDAPCNTLDVDHCHDGWGGSATLSDSRMTVNVSANLSHLVVFTNASKDFVAIEPVSHANNALNLMGQGHDAARLGVQVLGPGQSLTAQMRIAVSAPR